RLVPPFRHNVTLAFVTMKNRQIFICEKSGCELKNELNCFPIQNVSSKASYAQAAQQFYIREKAIILDSTEGSSIQEYIIEIGNLSVECQIYILKANCLYQDSEHIADMLIDNYTEVNIKSHSLELISKSK
ncbi:unnamed protein product, partial [Heterotrigona itama]